MEHLLVISSVWVEPNSSAAGSRMLQLMDAFQKQHWKITYVSTAAKSEFSYDLSLLGIPTKMILLNDSSFDDFLIELQPSIVLFDRFIIEEQFGWRVEEKLPKALRILDTEDLHCLRKTRELALKKKIPFIEADLLQQDIAKREIASILRCDISFIISTYEMHLLEHIFKINTDLLCYIPFLLDKLETNFKHTKSFKDRQHIYFIGNFLHNPNWDAVLYLKREIWPKLSKKIPNTELHIYGAYPSEKVTQLQNKKERFYIKGRAINLDKIIPNYKICLAPIRFGAGLKGKLIEAMQHGTPNITTRIGAEAMHDNLDWSGYITDKTEDTIQKTIQLYTNESLWLQAQKNGVKIINQNFNKDTFTKKLIRKITTTQKNITTHRNTNFIGNLLQHHTIKSTKYFSKWIEEKNK